MRQSRGAPPIINAPPFVTALAVIIVVAHILRLLAGEYLDGFFVDIGAVFPERFWGWAGVQMPTNVYPPYGNVLLALMPLAGTALVHGGWSHLLLNVIMLIAVGKPVYGVLRQITRSKTTGNALFLGVFVASVVGGSLAHLIAHYPVGPPAIGASGGVSGLIACALMVQNGPPARLMTRRFLTASAVFLIGNMILAFLGPSLVGSEIAWQAHVGGYIIGALVFRGLMARTDRAGI